MTMVGTGFAYSPQRRARQAAFLGGMLPQVRDLRRSGSSALDVCSVAAGWLDAYLEHGPHWWDWAAAALIAEEAGAVVRVPARPGSPAATTDWARTCCSWRRPGWPPGSPDWPPSWVPRRSRIRGRGQQAASRAVSSTVGSTPGDAVPEAAGSAGSALAEPSVPPPVPIWSRALRPRVAG